jgi:hypothetical protein
MSNPIPLKFVIIDLLERVGVPEAMLDLTDIDDLEIEGLNVTNAYPVSGTLQELGRVFFFDTVAFDGKLHFIKRGANSIATIPESELVDDDARLDEDRRGDSIAVPRALHLSYYDVAGALNTDKQTSYREGSPRATGEASVSTPVVMSANEAARALHKMHRVMQEEQRGDVEFSLPDSYLRLTPADVIVLQRSAKSERLRITQVEILEGQQRLRAMRDRQSAYTSAIEGLPAAPSTPPPSNLVGAPLLEIIDIRPLRDTHDTLLYYLALGGAFPAWYGATVELSLDGGATYIEADDWEDSTVIGELVAPLGLHPQEFPDYHNVLQVQVLTDLNDLEPATLAAMLNRANRAMVGDEQIAFSEVDEVYPGQWELRGLLRGRKGTTVQAHSPGARFVLLDTALVAPVPAEISYIGQLLTFRATSFGTTTDDAVVKSITYQGNSERELAVGYLVAQRDGNDLNISWIGSARRGAGVNFVPGANFLGYAVEAEDGLNTAAVTTISEAVTLNVTGWSSPITVRVAQRNAVTGNGPFTEITV